MITACDQLGVRLLIVSDLEEKLRHPVTHFEDDGFRFIGLREEPLENPLNRAFKRALDIVFALPIMIFVFPPLALIVWLAQRLQSPGPLFHRQIRAGIQNRRFEILKFRTMHLENHDLARQATTRGRSRLSVRQMVPQTEHRRGPAVLERPPRRDEHGRSAPALDRA